MTHDATDDAYDGRTFQTNQGPAEVKDVTETANETFLTLQHTETGEELGTIEEAQL